MPTKKLTKTKQAAAIAAAGLILTATGVYASRHMLESVWKLHTITQIIDGDTFIVNNKTTIRLIGINSPEKDQCFHSQSRQAVAKFLKDKSVYLEKEITGQDEYARLLRYAFIPAAGDREDNLFVNDYIVRQGWAQAMPSAPNSRYRDLLYAAQEEAINHNRGLWGACSEYKEELSERREKNDLPPSAAHVIKGNISGSGYGKTYVTPDCNNYSRIKVDFSKGEQYFKTIKDAERAGFRKATNCP